MTDDSFDFTKSHTQEELRAEIQRLQPLLKNVPVVDTSALTNWLKGVRTVPSKEENLVRAIEALTDALSAYGSIYLDLEIDCPAENLAELSNTLNEECACDNVITTVNDGRGKICCSTATGFSPKKN